MNHSAISAHASSSMSFSFSTNVGNYVEKPHRVRSTLGALSARWACNTIFSFSTGFRNFGQKVLKLADERFRRLTVEVEDSVAR